MKRVLFSLSLLTFLCSVFIACEQEKTWWEENSEELARLYPNESSELAWVMREISAKTELVKSQVEKGEEIDNIIDVFKQVHDAEATKPEVKTEAFANMASSFVDSFDRLLESQEGDRIKAYNMMIQNCVVCHTTYCPGPLVRIEKLKID
ncbi:hypothetical protein [Peijinzhouia sedimentorum]